MSLYQLIYLDKIPEYAIINEAVKIAKKEGLSNKSICKCGIEEFYKKRKKIVRGIRC